MAFVSRDRLKDASSVEAFPGAPDLAVEVLSPSNTPASMHAKVADYLAAGTRRVWVVDTDHETITIYASLLSPRIVASDGILDGEDVVPGFEIPVAELFEI